MRRRGGLTWDGNPTVKPPPGAAAVDWAHVLARNLGGLILFNEGGGVPRNLITSQPGTLNNGPTWSVSGRGGAITFDGTDDYVEIPDASEFMNFSGPYSVMLHVRSVGSWESYGGIFAKRSSGTNTGYTLQQKATAGTMQLYHDNTNAAELTNLTIASLQGRMHSLVVFADTTGPGGIWEGSAWLDGAENQIPTALTPADAAPTQGTASLVLGTERSAAACAAVQIGYYAAWSRVLTPHEILWLHAEPYALLRPYQARRYFVPAAGAAGNPWYAYAQQ